MHLRSQFQPKYTRNALIDALIEYYKIKGQWPYWATEPDLRRGSAGSRHWDDQVLARHCGVESLDIYWRYCGGLEAAKTDAAIRMRANTLMGTTPPVTAQANVIPEPTPEPAVNPAQANLTPEPCMTSDEMKELKALRQEHQTLLSLVTVMMQDKQTIIALIKDLATSVNELKAKSHTPNPVTTTVTATAYIPTPGLPKDDFKPEDFPGSSSLHGFPPTVAANLLNKLGVGNNTGWTAAKMLTVALELGWRGLVGKDPNGVLDPNFFLKGYENKIINGRLIFDSVVQYTPKALRYIDEHIVKVEAILNKKKTNATP